jgi:hypothetical protein
VSRGILQIAPRNLAKISAENCGPSNLALFHVMNVKQFNFIGIGVTDEGTGVRVPPTFSVLQQRKGGEEWGGEASYPPLLEAKLRQCLKAAANYS